MGMTKQEKAKFHKDLIDLLTDDENINDGTFFEKLVYANQIISNCLINFSDDIINPYEVLNGNRPDILWTETDRS